LAKIGRVAPEKEFIGLLDDLIKGRTTRASLRSTWANYRGVLRGRTARGRGVVAPKADLSSDEQRTAVAKAKCKNLLASGGAAWIGPLDSFSKAIADVLPSKAQSNESELSFDLVIITQDESGRHLAFHGVIISKPTNRLKRIVHELSAYCDYFWFAPLASAFTALEERELPAHVGIVVSEKNRVHVVRRPTKTHGQGKHSGKLAKALLAKILVSG
jgi:hypothetical protein